MNVGTSESATGGSASTQAVDAEANRWRTRRTTAVAIRLVAFLLPFGASFAVARVLAALLPAPQGVAGTAGWWSAVVLGSSAALVAVDRFARRLLPLAMLYRLALVFPDRAPSRYRLALRTGTVRQLKDRLDAGGDLGDTPAEACENLLALVAALGRHDRLTRGHSERVRAYADVIAQELALTASDRERLHWAALVHDVGKMRVRPEVLNKPGRPNDDEWDEIRSHPAQAEHMVAPLRPWLGDWVDAATQHHERVDGKGYPLGLTGDSITLAGRIVAVADAYDCMTSARSYKKPLPAAQARYELLRNSGTQFDAEVVRAFLGVSVGRVHLVGGPLAWLANVPGAREVVTLSGAGGATASTGLAAAAVSVVAAVGGVIAPPEPIETVAAARAAASPVVTVPVEPITPLGEPGPSGPEPLAVTTTIPEGAGAPSTTSTTAPGASTTTGPATGIFGPAPSVPTTSAPGSAPRQPSMTPTPPTTTTSAASPPPSTTTTIAIGPLVATDDNHSMGLLVTSATIDVLLNDHKQGGSLTPASLTIVSPPGAGSAQVVNGRIAYSRGLLDGSTTLRYRICDSGGECAQATVSITVGLL